MNADDVLGQLKTRYQGGGKEESHILIPEARSGAGNAGNNGQLDLVAIGCWQSVGLGIYGHEIKVSRQDWLKELKTPEKTERFMRYCHRFWLVVPKPWKDIVHDGELPDTWGLMEASPSGVRVVKGRTAPKLNPEPLPWTWLVGWMAQIGRSYGRNARRLDEATLRAEFEKGRASATSGATDYEMARLRRRAETAEAQAKLYRERLHVVGEVTGVDALKGSYLPSQQRIDAMRAVHAMATSEGGIERVRDRMRVQARVLGQTVSDLSNLVDSLLPDPQDETDA